jgi:hypothetical protein
MLPPRLRVKLNPCEPCHLIEQRQLVRHEPAKAMLVARLRDERRDNLG